LQKSKKTKTMAAKLMEESPFVIDLLADNNRSVYDVILEAIDEAFLSLGEEARAAIYLYLEKSVGIKNQEIPFRLDDFQSALEQLFGVGSKYMEILFMKKMHSKLQTYYRWNMPSCVVPDLTFKDYVRLVNMSFETSKAKNKRQAGESKFA
jgi:hypothetical protein